jgi:spermidine/putrescine transport system permease protein
MTTPGTIAPPKGGPSAAVGNLDESASRWHRVGFAFQLGLPLTFWIIVLGIPYVLMAIISFWPNNFLSGMHSGFTLHNWTTVFRVPLYREALVRSLAVAAIVTTLCILIGYPTAYFIATRVKRHRALVYVALQIPLWTAYLIRAYAWRVVLGQDGVIAKVIDALGGNGAPRWLLFSQFSVVLVITTMFIPFCTMAIYPALEAIPPSLREAARDLHAGRWRTFVKVTLPLSLPSVLAAATYTFAISFGDFISPTLVGGPRSIMMTQLIFNQIGVAYDWPLAAALALVMCIIVIPLVALSQRFESLQRVALRR